MNGSHGIQERMTPCGIVSGMGMGSLRNNMVFQNRLFSLGSKGIPYGHDINQDYDYSGTST